MTKSIIIIDDSRVSRMMMRAIIADKQSDWEIIEAENGDDTLTKVEGRAIDYFSVDLNMPGIDGLSLIAKLKPDFPDSKMALMTANVQDAITQQCKELQTAIFHKPITEESVSKMLRYFNE